MIEDDKGISDGRLWRNEKKSITLQKTSVYMLSKEISSALMSMKSYFEGQPIERAWLFGSCSRGEETPTSDIDILVDYKEGVRITLFTISRISLQLSDMVGRRVDLVERDGLLPFAVDSVNKDKILIYERKD